jgi:hypothetical protein
MAELYHYTCAHSVKEIREAGELEPHGHPLLAGMKLVWLTDLDAPNIEALGLTSQILRCRRTEFRAVVEAGETVEHWPTFVRALRKVGGDRMLRNIGDLESTPGVLPMHWWVSLWPVKVTSLEAVD